MKPPLAAFGAGALFATGLAVSGMTKPSKVAGFLDVAGQWDASLLFVMVGAIGLHFIARRLITRLRSPIFDTAFHIPNAKDIDLRLVMGAAVFGVGWGLSGLCPGPALVSAASGSLVAIVFVLGMTVGMFVEHRLVRPSRAAAMPGE